MLYSSCNHFTVYSFHFNSHASQWCLFEKSVPAQWWRRDSYSRIEFTQSFPHNPTILHYIPLASFVWKGFCFHFICWRIIFFIECSFVSGTLFCSFLFLIWCSFMYPIAGVLQTVNGCFLLNLPLDERTFQIFKLKYCWICSYFSFKFKWMNCRCRKYLCVFHHMLLFEKDPSNAEWRIFCVFVTLPSPPLYRQLTIFYRWIFGIALERFIAFVCYFPIILLDRQHFYLIQIRRELAFFNRFMHISTFIQLFFNFFFFNSTSYQIWICIQYSCTISSVQIRVPLQITLLLLFVWAKISYARSLLVFLIRFSFIVLFLIHVLFHV